MAATTVEVFSISATAILTPTGSQAAQFWGSRDGRLEIQSTTSDLREDDWVTGSWTNIHSVTFTVTSGYISFEALAYLASTNVTTSAGAPDNYWAYPLYPQYQANTRPVPVAIRCPAKDSEGATGTVDLVLYQVYIRGIEPSGISYKSGLTCSYTGVAVPSWHNDYGQLLNDRAFGRVVSWQSAKVSFTGHIGNYYLLSAKDAASASDQVKTSGNAFRALVSSSDTGRGSPETERLARVAVTSSAYPESAAGSDAASLRVATSDSDSAAGTEGGAWLRWASPNAQVSGTGTLTATPRPVKRASFSHTGYGQLTAHAIAVPAGVPPPAGAATIAGTGSLQAMPGYRGYASLTGTATAAATGGPRAVSAVAGTGSLTANKLVRAYGTASRSGTGTLSAQSQTGGSQSIETDSSTPAVTTYVNGGQTTTCTSASFSPPANCLVVVGVVWMWYYNRENDSVTVKDSGSNSYTQGVFLSTALNEFGSVGVWYRYYTSAPGAITVTATNTIGDRSGVLLAPRVLTGCAQTQSSAGKTTDSSDGSIALTTTQDGSRVIVVTTDSWNKAGTAAIDPTVTIRIWGDSSSSGCAACMGYLDTGAYGSYTAGFTQQTSGAALEILHA